MAVKHIIEKFKSSLQSFFLPGEENGYRAKIFTGNFLVIYFIAVLALKLGFAIFVYTFSNNPFYADITKTALIDLANEERLKLNLPQLAENPVLDQAAYMKALDMARNGYFNHISPAGINPWHWFDQAGYNYKYAGENLAIGFLESNEVQNAWVASPTHNANIINNKYKDIGIAVLKANFQGNPATIVVQLFGSTMTKSQTGNAPVLATNATTDTETGKLAGQSNLNGNLPASAKDVLGVSTEAVPDRGSADFKAISFFASRYFGIVQIIVYWALIFIILLLVLNFSLKADLAHADLLAKAVGFIAIMGIFALIDQNLIVALLPHTLSIE